MKLTASLSARRVSAPTVPPGTISPSYSSAETSENVFSTVNVSPGLTSLFMVWASPVWRPTTSTVAPASSTACLGCTNSACSEPAGASRMAIFLPCNSLGTGVLLSIYLHFRDTQPGRRLNGRDDCSTIAVLERNKPQKKDSGYRFQVLFLMSFLTPGKLIPQNCSMSQVLLLRRGRSCRRRVLRTRVRRMLACRHL